MNDFFSSMFGTIAGYSGLSRNGIGVDFIPANKKGQVIHVKGGSAHWLGLRNRLMQKYAYEFCFPVASVIDRLAELDLTGRVEILRSTGKGRDNFATNDWAVRMNALLDQPNGLQSWEEFRGQQMVYKKAFGFCPVLPIIPTGFEGQPWMAIALINLPPWLFDVEPTKNKFTASTSRTDIIKRYILRIWGEEISLNVDDVFILKDSFMQDEATGFTLPLSRMVGLDMAVSNICAAMEADNVLLRKKGPLGFISHDATTKDQVSYTPMSTKHKRELQNSLSRYGLSLAQFQYVISRTAARWVPMSFNVHELDTSGTIVKCEKAICHRYAYPYVLYEEQDATYANGDNAAASVYQMNVIPNANKDANQYNKFFKALENNCKFTRNFEDVGALQEDKKYEADARYALNQGLEIEYDNDLITRNQWLERLGWDKVEGGDVLKSVLEKSEQSIFAKLGVEGVNAVTAILSHSQLDHQGKKDALIILFGFAPKDAEKIAPADPKPEDTIDLDDNGEPIKKDDEPSPLKINLG
jgi:hypothetical protein